MANEKSKIVLFCQGGAGDVLAHTPMIRYFRKAYPNDEIVVLSTYKQLLEGNPNIDTLIALKDPRDFYDTHVFNKNVRFFKKHFVYDAILDDPAVGCKTLPEFICKVYGAEYDGGGLDYYITEYEKKAATVFLNQYRKTKNIPVVLLQCTGAIPSDGEMHKTNNLKDLNIEIINAVVKKNKDKIWFIQIGLEGEPVVPDAINALGTPMREAIALIWGCDSFVFIESLFAHCSNALGKRGVVVFQNTSPTFFGYTNNENLGDSGNCPVWPCNRPVGALLDLMPGYRNPKTRQPLLWECPDQVCARINPQKIEDALLKIVSAPIVKGNAALELVRAQPPPVSAKKPIESPSSGKTIAGDPNLSVELENPNIPNRLDP